MQCCGIRHDMRHAARRRQRCRTLWSRTVPWPCLPLVLGRRACPRSGARRIITIRSSFFGTGSHRHRAILSADGGRASTDTDRRLHPELEPLRASRFTAHRCAYIAPCAPLAVHVTVHSRRRSVLRSVVGSQPTGGVRRSVVSWSFTSLKTRLGIVAVPSGFRRAARCRLPCWPPRSSGCPELSSPRRRAVGAGPLHSSATSGVVPWAVVAKPRMRPSCAQSSSESWRPAPLRTPPHTATQPAAAHLRASHFKLRACWPSRGSVLSLPRLRRACSRSG